MNSNRYLRTFAGRTFAGQMPLHAREPGGPEAYPFAALHAFERQVAQELAAGPYHPEALKLLCSLLEASDATVAIWTGAPEATARAWREGREPVPAEAWGQLCLQAPSIRTDRFPQPAGSPTFDAATFTEITGTEEAARFNAEEAEARQAWEAKRTARIASPAPATGTGGE